MNETGYNMLNLTIANPDNKADVLLEAFNFARLKYSFLQCGAFGCVFIFMLPLKSCKIGENLELSS